MTNLQEITLWTALITPLLDTGAVDFESLTKLVRAQEAAGNGLLVLGSTGESLNLDESEKTEILKHVLSLNPKTPVMLGIGGIHLKSTIESIKAANKFSGVHAYLLVTPLYAKPGRVGQTEWFKALLNASEKPCMLYNVPGRTGVAMHVETVRDLKDHPNFFAIKEASGKPEDFKRYSEAAGERIMMMSGDDALCPAFKPYKLRGLVSVASNVWPAETARYIRHTLNDTLKHEDLWRDSSNALFSASNPIPVKALMATKGLIKTPLTRSPLDARDMKDLDLLQASDRNIAEWFQVTKN